MNVYWCLSTHFSYDTWQHGATSVTDMKRADGWVHLGFQFC